jgi:hypothetical protein
MPEAQTPDLYQWLGLTALPPSVQSIEGLIGAGGDWRSSLRALLLGCIARQDRTPLSYRILGGDALLIDGRVRQWELACTDAKSSVRDQVTKLHQKLSEELGNQNVRLTFRAMSCRLSQNGRFIPTKHSYFVANLWEPGSIDQQGESEPDGEFRHGTFAPATEFVFAHSSATTSPGEVAPEPVDNALRTITYLALSQLNQKTLHTIVQDLFTQRRPVLRVGPSTKPGQWTFDSFEPREDFEGRSVPAVLSIGIPRYGAFGRLRARVVEILRAKAQLSLHEFRRSIWTVVPEALYAFPWDSLAYDDSQPTHFGQHAESLVKALLNDDLFKSGDVWSEFLGSSEADAEAFAQALRDWLHTMSMTVSGPLAASVLDPEWMTSVYRVLLANSVHFDVPQREHRQVPIAIGSHGSQRQFVPAGIYLLTYETAVSETPADAFTETLASINSLHINNHASRTILSIAATRTLRRHLASQNKVVRIQTQLADEAAKVREARLNARRNATLIGDVLDQTRQINDKLRNNLSPPARIWDLWFGEPDGAILEKVAHPANIDSVEGLKHYKTLCDSAIKIVVDLLGDYSANEGGDRSFVRKLLALKDAGSSGLDDEREMFKRYARVWHDVDPRGGSLPQIVATMAGIQLQAMHTLVGRDQYYPSVPAIWADAIRKHKNNTRGLALQMASFLYCDKLGSTVAGFVSVNRLVDDMAWAKQVLDRFTTILGIYAEPFLGRMVERKVSWVGEDPAFQDSLIPPTTGTDPFVVTVFRGFALKSSDKRI